MARKGLCPYSSAVEHLSYKEDVGSSNLSGGTLGLNGTMVVKTACGTLSDAGSIPARSTAGDVGITPYLRS